LASTTKAGTSISSRREVQDLRVNAVLVRCHILIEL
jgi:hypothetical protein